MLHPQTATFIKPIVIYSGSFSTRVLPKLSTGEILDQFLQSGGSAFYHSPAFLLTVVKFNASIILNLSGIFSLSWSSISPCPSILNWPKAKNI